jgi:Flp pilus assembly secretin CpaC
LTDAVKGSLPLVQSQLSFYRISQTGLSALGVSTSAPATSYPESALTKVSTPNISAKLRGGPVLNFSLPELLLKAHTQRGIIQQIAQPAIVVASGSRGEILSGGELLFQSGGQHQKFFSQNYGISVVLQPRVVSPNKIVQRIELKITHPQSDPTQNAISALSSSVLNTEVSSQVNELLLLTRISQKANGKSTMKIPILGHIPILGELFKSRELSGEDAELWITLKSDLVVPEPPTLESEIRNKETSTEPHWLD